MTTITKVSSENNGWQEDTLVVEVPATKEMPAKIAVFGQTPAQVDAAFKTVIGMDANALYVDNGIPCICTDHPKYNPETMIWLLANDAKTNNLVWQTMEVMLHLHDDLSKDQLEILQQRITEALY